MNRKLAALLLLLPLALTACKVGGRGWVPSASGSGEATFAFHGRCDKNDPPQASGRLRYVDTLADGSTLRLNGKVTTAACKWSPFLVFTGEYGSPKNGSGGSFFVMLLDGGESGPSAKDWLFISVTGGAHDGYANSGLVGGGTIR